jgi:hypothetical protein
MKGSITGNEIPRGRAHARPTLPQRGDAQVITRHEHELTRTWPVFSSLDEKLDLRSLSPNFGIDHTGVPPKTACECSVSLLPNTGRMQHPIGHCDPSLVCPYQVASVYIRLGLYRGIVAASGSVLLSDEAQAAESKDHVGFGRTRSWRRLWRSLFSPGLSRFQRLSIELRRAYVCGISGA